MTLCDSRSVRMILLLSVLGVTKVFANSGEGLHDTTAMDKYSFELMAKADAIYTTYESLGEDTTPSGKPVVTDEDYNKLKQKLSTLIDDVEAGITKMHEQSTVTEDPDACRKGIDKYQTRLLAEFKKKTSSREYVERGFENDLPLEALALTQSFGTYVLEQCRQSH